LGQKEGDTALFSFVSKTGKIAYSTAGGSIRKGEKKTLKRRIEEGSPCRGSEKKNSNALGHGAI